MSMVPIHLTIFFKADFVYRAQRYWISCGT
jgi:hypothetical protein